MKTVLFAAILFPMFASAATTLTYELDYKNSKIDADTAEGLCALPKEISMDAREDLATVVITKTQGPKVQRGVKTPKFNITTIQATKGSITGDEPLSGDYRTRVALTQLEVEGYGDVYSRVEINTYGSPSAPKAFTVDYELLNHRESAELGEDSLCTGYTYILMGKKIESN